MSSIPYLKEQNGKKVLMVNDEPFIMLAGEVHNSNSSSVEYMKGVWEKADALGMNCLLLPVTWELTEPEEGVFDFSLVDGLIGVGNRMGEGWFLPAEMIELVNHGYENIVCTQPFGCLPTHVCGKGMIHRIKEMYPQANIVPIDYDPGATKVNQENRIKLLLAVAREAMERGEA